MSSAQLDTEHYDATFSVKLPPRPYPGLRPFEKEEWPIFFGRETMADAVVAQLIEKRLLVIHGDSGCGKSSLVRAAVLPRLEQDSARGGIRWRTAVMMPGQSPLLNLARALERLDGGPVDEGRVLAIRRLLNLGRDAPYEIATLLRERENDCICIVFDQFEELFAHARRVGPEDAQILVSFLVSLLNDPPDGLYAAITMRSEFIGACARFAGFAEAVNATQYLLPRMQHRDIVRAIREPATLYGGEITSQLAERLIADAGDSQDQLPLIQHGLMLLHRENVDGLPEGESWKLDVAQYDNPRGLAGQLSEHADSVMQEAERRYLKGANGTRVVEAVFRALTEINADGHAIRRPQSLRRLANLTGTDVETLRGVIDLFRADGTSLLRPHGADWLGDDTLVDISHEALIRSWERLSNPTTGWLNREFRDGLIWRALLVQTEAFERDPSNLLAPTTTDERERWIHDRNSHWAEQYGGGWDRVQKLISASATARDLERKRLARRLRLRRLSVFLAFVLLFLFALALAYWQYAIHQEAVQEAVEETDETTALLNQAEVTISNERAKAKQAEARNVALQEVVTEQSVIVEKIVNDAAVPTAELQRVGDTLKAAASGVIDGTATEGFIWLGNERARNLRDENGLVDVARVQAGSTYSSAQKLILREAPASGVLSGQQIGLVPKGSQLRVLAPPQMVGNSSGRLQSWVQVRILSRPNAPAAKPKVFLQYAEGSELDLKLLQDQLRNAKYDMPAGEKLPSAAGLSEVRYCHAEDATAAAGLARAVEELRKGIPVEVKPISGDRQCLRVTSPGTLELWLGEL